MTRVCLIHGWAYSPQLWTDLIPELKGVEVSCFDLGFFGPADVPGKTYDIAITHSYGLMWLLKHEDLQCSKIISINGIAAFAQSDSLPHGVANSQLRAMRQHLRTDPQGLLRGFYEASGDTQYAGPGQPDSEALKNALEDMEVLDLRARLKGADILALASKDDKIVPQDLTLENFAQNPIIWHDSDSHILPKTAPGWCAAHIEEFINA